MGLFSKRTPKQVAAIKAKERFKLRAGILGDEKKAVKENRLTIESQIKRNNRGDLSPQEQAVIVTANRSSKIEKGDLSELPRGNRNEQTALVLDKQRDKLLKEEQEIDFRKDKLEVQAKWLIMKNQEKNSSQH